MTHPTDEELDALVGRLKQLEGRMSFQSQNMTCARTCRLSAAAITALRTQLAEAQAELVRRVVMHECAMAERDVATLYSEEQKARADRAGAALAAQIEADALVCDELAAACAMALALASNDTPEVRTAVAYSIKIAKRCAATIRNQPHDRTALDRMLAEAREKALREAAEMVRGTAYTSSNVGRRLEPVSPAMAGMDMHHATIADAILALIEATHAQP